jgi:anti-anti-sigma factor
VFRGIRLVVRPHGELTAQTATGNRQQLLRALAKGPDVLEIDLSRVTYLTSEGCGPLLAAANVARSVDAHLVISHADTRTRALLTQVGLSATLDGCDSSAE